MDSQKKNYNSLNCSFSNGDEKKLVYKNRIIALKNLIPIYIRRNVIEKVKSKSIIEMQHFPEKIDDSKNQYNNKNIINNLMGALDKAVNEENYEIAAKIRDRIKNLKTKQIN